MPRGLRAPSTALPAALHCPCSCSGTLQGWHRGFHRSEGKPNRASPSAPARGEAALPDSGLQTHGHSTPAHSVPKAPPAPRFLLKFDLLQCILCQHRASFSHCPTASHGVICLIFTSATQDCSPKDCRDSGESCDPCKTGEGGTNPVKSGKNF